MRAILVTLIITILSVSSYPVSAQEGSQLEAYEYLKKANRLYEAGELKEALSYYRKIIRLSPSMMEAWEKLLAIDYTEGRYAQAYELADRALKQSASEDKKSGVYMWKGLAGALLGKKDAVVWLEKAVKLDPSRFLAYYEPLHGIGLARIYQFSGQWQKAIAAYKAFLKYRPESLSSEVDHVVLFRLGECFLYINKPKDALSVCERSMKLRPTYLSSVWCKAESLRRMEKYGQAYLYFRKIVRYAPKHPRILQGMAVTTLYTGKGYRALSYARRYVALRPGDPYGHALLGDIQYALGDYPRALASYRKALALDPAVKAFYIKLGVAYYRIKNYREAVAILKKGLLSYPGDEDISVPLAHSLVALKRYGEAYDILKKTKIRHEIRVKSIMASALLGMKRPKEAINVFRQVYPKRKDDDQVKRGYVRALLQAAYQELQKDNIDGSMAYIKEGYGITPSNPVLLKNLALLAYLKKDLNSTLGYLKQLDKVSVEDYFLYRLRGRIALDQGRYKEAITLLSKAEQSARRLTSRILARVQMDYAVALMQAGDPEKGVEMLELARTSGLEEPKLLEWIEKDLFRARLVRSVYRITAGKPQKALEDLKLLLEDSTAKEQRKRIYFLMSMAHLELGNWRQASYMLGRAGKGRDLALLFKTKYQEIGPQILRAYILYRQGSFSLARDIFKKAMTKAPRNLRYELDLFIKSCDQHLAYTHLRHGRIKQAISLLKVLPAAVLDDRSRSNLAVALYRSGRHSEAVQIWKGLGTALAACNLAAHYHNTGHQKEAYAYYKTCIGGGLGGKKARQRLNAMQKLFGFQ